MADLGFKAIDMDNHYYEDLDCFSRHIEPRFKDQAITVRTVEDGLQRWTLGDLQETFTGIFPSLGSPPPGSLAGFLAGTDTEKFTEALGGLIKPQDYPEFIEHDARVELLDRQGLDAVLMISNAAITCEHFFRPNPQALCANFRSFNRWLEEDWGYGADGRIFSVPLLTLVDVDWAAEEVRRVAGLGSRFIYLMMGPVQGRSPADPYFDPFWATVQETGVKPVFHIAYEGFPHLYGTHWGEDPNRAVFQLSPFQHYLCWGERVAADHFASLILHNLFGRFPGIEVLSVENGSHWVRPLLRSMDKAQKLGMLGPALGGYVTERASDVFRRHVYVTPFHEDDIVDLIDAIGSERVLFGSDYPHPEGLAVPLDFARGSLSGVDDEVVVRNVMRGNAARLVGLES